MTAFGPDGPSDPEAPFADRLDPEPAAVADDVGEISAVAASDAPVSAEHSASFEHLAGPRTFGPGSIDTGTRDTGPIDTGPRGTGLIGPVAERRAESGGTLVPSLAVSLTPDVSLTPAASPSPSASPNPPASPSPPASLSPSASPSPPASLSPAASLTPAERVIPTWTDPTVRRASEVIGGPMGRHALVGRATFLTPLRVALLLAIAVLICGWLFKSPCIQTGPGGGLDQSGQRPWITGCYNDVVPLYGGRGLENPARNPYAYVWSERNSDADHESSWTVRVYPPGEVTVSDGTVVAQDAGEQVTLSDGTLVGTPGTGYQQVEKGRLEPIATDQIGTVRYLEYPVLTGMFVWGTTALNGAYLNFAKATGVVPVPLNVASYFTIGAILLGLFYLWAVASTAKIARRRPWDTAIMCLSPLLIVHAFTNWDLLAIGFTAGAMLAWARGRPVLAGALIGLGTAAKLYPALLLGPLLVLCLRSGKMGSWTRAALSGAVVWVAVNLPIYLLYPDAWGEFFRMNSTRGAEWDSWYYLYSFVSGSKVFDSRSLLNAVSLLLFIAACVAIGWFALSARRRPRFAQLAFLVVAAFILTNKVWSPQYSLWLVPLIALALPRWRRVLPWQFAEWVVWMVLLISQFDSDHSRALPTEVFIAAAIVRDALLIALVVRVVREAIRPDLDLIRLSGDDDPSGGVLEGTADRFTLPSLPSLWRRSFRRPRPVATDQGAANRGGSEQGEPEPVGPAVARW